KVDSCRKVCGLTIQYLSLLLDEQVIKGCIFPNTRASYVWTVGIHILPLILSVPSIPHLSFPFIPLRSFYTSIHTFPFCSAHLLSLLLLLRVQLAVVDGKR